MLLLQPLIINLHIFPSGLPTKDSLSLFISLISSPLTFWPTLWSHHLFSIPVSEQTHFISSCFSDQLSCHLFFDCSQQMNSFHLLSLFWSTLSIPVSEQRPNPDALPPSSFPYEGSSSHIVTPLSHCGTCCSFIACLLPFPLPGSFIPYGPMRLTFLSLNLAVL